jgi:hypothetical protein
MEGLILMLLKPLKNRTTCLYIKNASICSEFLYVLRTILKVKTGLFPNRVN